jgi:phenylpropionate dioxygenase-like ring-hydroxylating dioxygenase large terminal subunit
MSDDQPVSPEGDLPPELFDDSFVQHDATIGHANWRIALENLSDSHTNSVHRNAVQALMPHFMKVADRGA